MLTALEWNSMDWGPRYVPAFTILFASSTVPGLIPALPGQEALSYSDRGIRTAPFSLVVWDVCHHIVCCGRHIYPVSGTASPTEQIPDWLLGALRPAGGGAPVSQLVIVVWCAGWHGMAWHGRDVPVGVVWCALAQPVLLSPAHLQGVTWVGVGGRQHLSGKAFLSAAGMR